MASFQYNQLIHFPNLNSLMKLSLGLVFFTIISTALVYAETIPVNVDGNSFDVQYASTGLSVTEIESDTESMSLIFSVDVVDLTGTLDVTFERTFFDSIYDGDDDLFFILADGDEAISEEIKTTSQSRSLSIKVPSGTEELEIIGSVFDNSKSFEFVLVEEPIVEEPIVESMFDNSCGLGTILKNNMCVLDERCGSGTVLVDGECIVEESSVKSTTVSKSMSKELIIGMVVALVIAGIIGIILGLMSKANKNNN
ncbi:MAG: hypothetical protein HOG57_01675 [Nitrosopumilus sp.]|nr:hypothetical protein [Nitrosopumilus sp.]MBT4298569.1 hypothetical protein [Nitrosopumilus sp.]MBT5278399.1 hypothetical protein [Nitrosopumilus sp.]MBT6083237.1 hypothetical protein [Nitrosopumilus sp.]MBT6397983.1 hypothetical protein [Nitrosopumilus sp.]